MRSTEEISEDLDVLFQCVSQPFQPGQQVDKIRALLGHRFSLWTPTHLFENTSGFALRISLNLA